MPALSCSLVIGFSSRKEHPDFVVEIGDGGDEVLVSGLGGVLQLGGDFLDVVGRAHRVVIDVDNGLLVDHVDLALEIIFLPDGNEDRPGVRAELLAHFLDAILEVRADAVHLVDEPDAGHLVLVGLTPDGLGLRLHGGDGVEHGDGAVEHAERTLHLGREVHVAGGVDDIDPHLSGLRTA